MDLELFQYQRQTVSWMARNRLGIIGHEMGLGKTACAIVGADLPALVVAPASLVINWRREIELWRPEAHGDFDVVSYADPLLGARLYDSMMYRRYATVIADEVHYVKTPTAKRSRAVLRMMSEQRKRGGRAYGLSGTVPPNRPIELWGLLLALGALPEGLRREDQYGRRFCGAHQNPHARAKGELDYRGATRLPELRELLSPYMIRYTKAQVLPQLPPKTWRVVALNLPLPEQEKEFDRRALQLMPEPVAMETCSELLRLHGERKAPAVADYVLDAAESSNKIVLFAHHRSVIAALREACAALNPVVVHGGHSKRQRQQSVDRFQDDAGTRLFIGQWQAAGIGWNLTAAQHVIAAEASWVPAILDQGADRCHRIGQKGNVLVDLLTIDRSIDEHQLRRALDKLRIIRQIVPVTDFSTSTLDTCDPLG